MSREQKIVVIARVCHEANRAWCEAHEDSSQKAWEDAEGWQRESAVSGVRFGLSGDGPVAQHDAWQSAKLADGWVYGEVKDPDAKTHPCLVPYDQLPEMQRAKDHLFLAVVAALAPSMRLGSD